MVTVSTRVTLELDAVDTVLKNGDTVLLHLGTNRYYTLNETGSHIWRLLGKGLSLGEIGRSIESEFDVSLNQAQRSVIDLAEELVAEKLVSLADEK